MCYYLLFGLLSGTLLPLILCHQLLIVLPQQLHLHVLLLIDAIGGVQALQHVHQQGHQVLHHILVVPIDHPLELLIDAPSQLLDLEGGVARGEIEEERKVHKLSDFIFEAKEQKVHGISRIK